MTRYLTVTLEQRNVQCIAKLLDDEAPRTAAAVWDALPHTGQVFHGKYARNEIYNLVPPFAEPPGPENTTITPIPGDLCYFDFTGGQLGNPAYGYAAGGSGDDTSAVVDLAVFYGRNNLLINGDQGWVPGNVFGAIVENFDAFAVACQDIWMGGARGETLTFARKD
ncbi:MAG: DUF3830 family protein [Nocardioidaceae bacterium]